MRKEKKKLTFSQSVLKMILLIGLAEDRIRASTVWECRSLSNSAKTKWTGKTLMEVYTSGAYPRKRQTDGSTYL